MRVGSAQSVLLVRESFAALQLLTLKPPFRLSQVLQRELPQHTSTSNFSHFSFLCSSRGNAALISLLLWAYPFEPKKSLSRLLQGLHRNRTFPELSFPDNRV